MNFTKFKFFKKEYSKDKLLILIASLGLILFILISSSFTFRNKLFSLLFGSKYSLAAGPTDWNQVQKDPQRTGYSAETLGLSFTKKWTYLFPPERVHYQVQPIIYSNSVYIGTETGNLYAIDTQTGQKRTGWPFAAGGPILHSVAADNGKVYFGAMDGAVYAVDTATGQQVWKTQVSIKGISTAPVLADGKVMLGGRDGYFFGLDAESGALLWKYNAGAPILMTAAFDAGKAFFGSMDMYVHAVNTTDGSQAWKSAKLAGMSMDRYWPVIHQGKVIVNTMAAIPNKIKNTPPGISPKFPAYSTLSTSDIEAIKSGNMTQVASMMSVQDTVMADYGANPSKYHKVTYILDVNTGAESLVVPHTAYQVHNGQANPPCIDRDGKLIVPVDFITSGWGRLDLNTQRIVDILYDGKDVGGNPYTPGISQYAAGFGNYDETYGLSCSANLILAFHITGIGSGGGFVSAMYTGAFDLDKRIWTNIPGGGGFVMSGAIEFGAHAGAISNGKIYHIDTHKLIARETGSAPTPGPTSTPTPTPSGPTPTPTPTPTPSGATPTPTPVGCANTSVGLTPLNDLGTGSYLGKQGGLYAGGSNTRPTAHEAAGTALAQSIVPLDSNGNPDVVNGKYVLLSIGMSNTAEEYCVRDKDINKPCNPNSFMTKAAADAEINPKLVLVNGAQSGQTVEIIKSPNAAFWDNINNPDPSIGRLAARGVTPNQVVAVWVKEVYTTSPTDNFPTSEEVFRNGLAAVARVLKTKYPNIKLAYFSSRIYGGYSLTTISPEPYAYRGGFGVKWLIEGQINNDPVLNVNYDSAKGTVVSPWFSWAPYIWADGLTPRSDGLTWQCSDFVSDGLHPSSTGIDKVAKMLLSFFKTDVTTKGWFLK